MGRGYLEAGETCEYFFALGVELAHLLMQLERGDKGLDVGVIGLKLAVGLAGELLPNSLISLLIRGPRPVHHGS